MMVPSERIKVYTLRGGKCLFQTSDSKAHYFFYLYYPERKYHFGIPLHKSQLESVVALEKTIKDGIQHFNKELDKYGENKAKINR